MARIIRLLKNRDWLVFLTLAVMVILLRLPSLEHPFDNDSAANAYHARLIVHGEPLYGSHHPAHHLPAVYYIYAMAFFLFGDSLSAVKIFLTLWIIVTVYLLYWLGVVLINKTTGFLAATFYGVLTAQLWMWGNSAEIEQFANLPRIGAFLILVILVKHYPVNAGLGHDWKFLFVGLLGAVAFLFKAVYVSPLILAGIILLMEIWPHRTKVGVWQTTFKRGVWIAVGFGSGLLAVAAYFGRLGLLPRLLMVFTLGQNYVGRSTESWQYVLFYPLLGLAYNNIILLILSLVGLVVITVNKTYRVSTLGYVAVWYLLSLFEAGLFVRVFRFYYYILIIPPLSLLGGWILLHSYTDVKSRFRSFEPMIVRLVLTGTLLIALAHSIVQNYNFYYHYVSYRLGYETHRDFLIEGSPFGPQLVQLQDVADYVQAHTHPTDYIFYWSENVQLYYLANRLTPMETVWIHYVPLIMGSYQPVIVSSPKYFIIDTHREGWTWALPVLEKNYQLETTMYDQEIYRRLDQRWKNH